MNQYNSLERWIKRRYVMLLNEFKDREFSFDDAFLLLSKKYEDNPEQVKVIISELNKAGLLEIKRNPDDKRERIYKLKNIFEISSQKLTKDELITILKQAADIIRTRVDYTFILILLFYKAYSDKWQKETERKAKELIEKGWREDEAWREASFPSYHYFQFTKDLLWENIRREPLKVSEKLSIAMKKLSELNPDYSDIFSQFDFYQFISNEEHNAILRQLIEVFSKYSFAEIEGDILGDAYEWILKYFAPQKAKEGEVYTPREVIRLMVEILKPEPLKSLYDPALGSGGMLIVAHQYVKEKYGEEEAKKLYLYGQEANPKTLALAKMNLLLHNITGAQLRYGDTLLYPKFKIDSSIQQFDYVIANPPWNQDGYDEEVLKKGEFYKERYKYGYPTKTSADWAWIQHMLSSAKDDGKVCIVIDTGAVSRGGREKVIRSKIIEEDLIESVILLPEKLFYNTGAPAVIIVFNKKKSAERRGKILLINASKEFQPGKKQNSLGKEHIRKIAETYNQFKEVEGFSRIITLEEAKEADYNLSPSRFVIAIEEEKYRSIEEIKKDLEELEEERRMVEEKIKKFKFY